MKRVQQETGFTLVEVLLTIATVGVLTLITVPLLGIFQVKNNIAIATADVVNALYAAQVRSHGVKGDEQWGVYITPSQITVFQGTSFASRNTNEDKVVDMTSITSVTGVTEVVFSKVYAAPSTTGDITLTATQGGQHTITLTSQGVIEHN